MPPCEAEYLVAYLFDAGPVMAAGMGVATLSHQELQAFCELTGIALQPWEARMLRNLSRDYLTASQAAEKIDCPAPWAAGNLHGQLAAKHIQDTVAALAKL